MPLLHVFTSAALPTDRPAWLRHLSALLSRELDKPEDYVMVIAAPRPEMTFGGSTDPACYAELKNVGRLDDAKIEALSRTLCDELAVSLHVPSDRIYIEFTNADGKLWGWNGTTFG
jgi:phenylpyruvate tautomerase PptA (4-oxalocrotonate tautomerase family)